MVLGPQGPGRVGRRRFLDERRAVLWAALRRWCCRLKASSGLPGVSALPAGRGCRRNRRRPGRRSSVLNALGSDARSCGAWISCRGQGASERWSVGRLRVLSRIGVRGSNGSGVWQTCARGCVEPGLRRGRCVSGRWWGWLGAWACARLRQSSGACGVGCGVSRSAKARRNAQQRRMRVARRSESETNMCSRSLRRAADGWFRFWLFGGELAGRARDLAAPANRTPAAAWRGAFRDVGSGRRRCRGDLPALRARR